MGVENNDKVGQIKTLQKNSMDIKWFFENIACLTDLTWMGENREQKKLN